MKYDLENMTREMALSILELPDKELPILLEKVYEIRKKYKGNTVGIQLLTNARSGDCTQDCTYCAQSRDSKADIDKYKLITYETLQQDGYTVKEKNLSRHCIGLSGIRFSDREISEFADEVRMLKKETGSPICCSIGFLTEQQAVMLREAGVDRINHNLNTSRKHYPSICTSHTYEERLDNIKRLKSLGFELCCGGIIGLGEDNTDVVDMLFQIQSIQPKAVPINFLIPLKGTALEDRDTSYLTGDYCLKILCLARLLCPQSDIRCAAGREVYLKGREKQMFYAADSIFASGYLTADGQGIDDTIKMITDAGFQYYVEP